MEICESELPCSGVHLMVLSGVGAEPALDGCQRATKAQPAFFQPQKRLRRSRSPKHSDNDNEIMKRVVVSDHV